MTIDLKNVKDHPATLLMAEVGFHGPSTDEGLERGARILEKHEARNDVTFAALDNDALTAVSEAYTERAEALYGSDAWFQANAVFADAVRDLLGLGDE